MDGRPGPNRTGRETLLNTMTIASAAKKLNNLNDLVNAVYAAKKKFRAQHLWWRGQARTEWALMPRLYQDGESSKEHNLTQLFKSRAKVRHHRCPAPEDLSAWLFLMQHYGLPTRLMNWSESILVAAYFAVSSEKYQNEPGVLYGLEPTLMNECQINRKGVVVHHDESVEQLIRDAFTPPVEDQPRDNRTLAILTDQLDVRQIVQFSTFTIHGSAIPITEMPEASKFLIPFEIPVPAKPQILQALELLGIRKSFLFPDLQHLVDDIQTIEFE